MFTQEDNELIQREFESLRIASLKRCANQEEYEDVIRAFEFANEAHKGVRRRSGEPYILHPIAVAKIVVEEIGLGYKSIVTALLHDIVEDTEYTVEDLSRLFGPKVASLVDGLTKIKSAMDNKHNSNKNDEISMQAENFKRILLTLNDDVRVVLIKLADRLHNLRTIGSMPERKKDKILSESIYIFVPLAHKLGLYRMKSEMENIWLQYREPEYYARITQQIENLIDERGDSIDQFIAPINQALHYEGYKFTITKRIKSPYSIWKKMEKKGVPFEQIYDLFAVRIIFEPKEGISERKQCWDIYSIISEHYRAKMDRIRDWVSVPKSNGYEALHCTLMSRTGIWIEVQIRSRRMNEVAEKGIAAHWAYKKDGFASNESQMDKWITKVKEILVNPDVNALDLLDMIHNDLVTTDILVFTPKGEQKSIEKGATALDFAYSIHSQIGNKAIAAKVNLKLVPLSYVLKTGDQIEIITAENEKPKREWLEFVKTSKARKFILDSLKSQRQNTINIGKAKLTEELESIGRKLNDKTIRSLMEEFEIFDSKPEELYFKIGSGVISLDGLSENLKKYNGINKESYFVISNSDEKHKYILASCCTPIRGENVIGFKASDGTITVHRRTCPNANSLAAKFGDKILSVKWADKENSGNHYLARITLRGTDRLGMINDITRITSKVMGVNIRRFNIGTEDGIFDGFIDLYINDMNNLEDLIKKLHRIKGLEKVTRTDL